MATPAKYMRLATIMQDYSPGDEWDWIHEIAWLSWHHHGRLLSLVYDIKTNGIREPILLGDDGRVWDGHHRVAAVFRLQEEFGFPMSLPVSFAKDMQYVG